MSEAYLGCLIGNEERRAPIVIVKHKVLPEGIQEFFLMVEGFDFSVHATLHKDGKHHFKFKPPAHKDAEEMIWEDPIKLPDGKQLLGTIALDAELHFETSTPLRSVLPIDQKNICLAHTKNLDGGGPKPGHVYIVDVYVNMDKIVSDDSTGILRFMIEQLPTPPTWVETRDLDAKVLNGTGAPLTSEKIEELKQKDMWLFCMTAKGPEGKPAVWIPSPKNLKIEML